VKTAFSLVPGYPSLLQIKYPAVSTALTKDFKIIEAQMEVDIADANDLNQRYVSNLQERIIAQEASLAKSENVMKSKFICIPIDPSKGKNYTCHNGDWQGATYDDSSIDEEYLCKYKIMVPINIVDGGGVDKGTTLSPGSCGWHYYITWLIPVSGQYSDKLAEKSTKKEAVKLKTKEDKALDMFKGLNIS
jgi:hypothetical protein